MPTTHDARRNRAFPTLAAAFTLLLLSAGIRVAHAQQTAQPGDLLVVSSGDNRVLRYDGKTGAFLNTFVSSGSGGLSSPESLIYGPDGNLYVSSQGTGSVLRYNGKTGAFLDAFIPSGSGGLSNPDQLAFGPDGNLYVSDRFFGQVLRYDGQTDAPLGTFVADFRLEGFIGFTLSFCPTTSLKQEIQLVWLPR